MSPIPFRSCPDALPSRFGHALTHAVSRLDEARIQVLDDRFFHGVLRGVGCGRNVISLGREGCLWMVVGTPKPFGAA
jgi:hypothetical protein